MKTLTSKDIKVPVNYFELTDEEKEQLHIISRNILMNMLKYHPDRVEIINQVITQSIQISEQNENYEMCYALTEILKLVNEKRN
jgi:hypothetical protein